MTTSATSLATVRPYEPGDEPDVLALLDASLGPSPAGAFTPEFFRWKHLAGPWGPSIMLVAEEGGSLVGFRALMRWGFTVDGRRVGAVRPVDTATHPQFRGRGIFSRLTRESLSRLPAGTALVFNTPNDKSGPGYLKMGWTIAGRVPVRLRVRRPVRFLAGSRSAGKAAPSLPPGLGGEAAVDALADGRAVDRLLGSIPRPVGRIETERDLAYLRWRYAEGPVPYRAVRQMRAGDLVGLALFRVRARRGLAEATVSDLLVGGGDRGTAGSLLRAVIASAPVDHLSCAQPSGSPAARAALRCGFLPSPAGVNLATRPLVEMDPDPTNLGSWALSLGDLELF